MPDPNTVDYFARIIGVLGAITGVGGLIIAIAANRKVQAMKSLDLRLELRKGVNDLRLSFEKMPGIINYADKSKHAVASAKGVSLSGGMKRWEKQVADSKTQLAALSLKIPDASEKFENLSTSELENEIVKTHDTQQRMNALESFFKEALVQDAEAIKGMAADQRALMSRPQTSSFS